MPSSRSPWRSRKIRSSYSRHGTRHGSPASTKSARPASPCCGGSPRYRRTSPPRSSKMDPADSPDHGLSIVRLLSNPDRPQTPIALLGRTFMPLSCRRDFLKQSAILLSLGGTLPMSAEPQKSTADFAAYQAQRRKELWSLLGELPWDHQPGPAKVLAREKHDGYTLERLVLDLNGIEPVPALLLIPDKRAARAPGL